MLAYFIATVESRREQFEDIWEKLESQIRAAGLQRAVELLYERDNREQSVGTKRNS